MSDAQPQVPQPEIQIVGYCRTCGTGLDAANVRMANGTIYCADHVPAESASTGTGAGPSSTGWTTASSASPTGEPPKYQSAYAHSPYSGPEQRPGEGSPGVAFVLGLI